MPIRLAPLLDVCSCRRTKARSLARCKPAGLSRGRRVSEVIRTRYSQSEASARVQVSRTPASRNRPRAPMRRPRSAKARKRGPEEAWFRRRYLWGFEACERQVLRGRNYERAALWRVARSRGAYAAGIGIRFGVAAAIVRRWRGIIERAPSRLANGQPQEWQERMALRRVDNAISIMRYRSGSRGARRLAGTSAHGPLRPSR